MKVGGKHYRTIWVDPDNPKNIKVIDQRWLPHEFVIEDLDNSDKVATAISEMHVRGAGLIGATAGYGMYLGCIEVGSRTSHPKDFDVLIDDVGRKLKSTRPTAVNLAWGVDRQLEEIKKKETIDAKIEVAFKTANEIAEEDSGYCKRIGEYGLPLIKEIYERTGRPVNILTHCNAGWLAFVDYGSATAPIYAAHDAGVPIHVWVDETRPRNQGSRLTAWELLGHGVPHTVIVDNVGGHLMQHGKVDIVITGTDRTTYGGDVCNKIGTYLKALAAKANDVLFYVALPSSTFDWDIEDGMQIPIEERGGDEVTHIQGKVDGEIKRVLLSPEGSAAVNYAFDVTPRHLVTGLITERGICKADSEDIYRLFPEHRK